ncbi:peptide synthetase [Streptomyces sp. JV178]|uniref:amino acid adenylation domain-containing protein n=1 Tax=Streptomyces sp. JV178 TaxID=858632 RepID=UPI000C1B1740|nr:amino acid adenylation domain-containing protein [Streptomyces sp. JV178]PIM71573.1 peptide synthetase [Streptomyces sp. JV178]
MSTPDLNQRLADVVARFPDRPAVRDESSHLTYAELDAAVAAASTTLTARGVTPGSTVMVRCEAGAELVVVLLAILRAGACYLPLDPATPATRADMILADACPAAIVEQTSGAAENTTPLTATTRLRVLDPGPGSRPVPYASPADPADRTAYIIYTSGTTGVPKGVPVTHRSLAALFDAASDVVELNEQDRWLLLHSTNFDFSVWEMWGALLHGGYLYVPERWSLMDVRATVALVRDQRITVLNQTPTEFGTLASELVRTGDAPDLRYVVLGGERLLPATLKPWAEAFGLDRPAVVNAYGITETTVVATMHRIVPKDLDQEDSVIGSPLRGFHAVVVDEDGRPATRGELLLAGEQVVAGYLNRPELTERRFIRLDGGFDGGFGSGSDGGFGSGKDQVHYRSGDVVEYRPDGLLRYLGRIDDQVKVRGYRIELGEIEHAVTAVEGIADACALTIPGAKGDVLACAFTMRDGVELSPRQVRSEIRSRLPLYMVPTKIRPVNALPRTINGKTDRAALRSMAWDVRDETQPLDPPRKVNSMLHSNGRIDESAIDRWLELENTDPRRVIDTFYAEDVEVSFPGLPELTIRGRKELHGFKDVADSAFRDRRVEIFRSYVSGDSAVVSEGTLRAVSIQTGEAVELFFCLVWTINGEGLIATERQYLQNGPILAVALGLGGEDAGGAG